MSVEKPLLNAYTRVFMISGQARPDHAPSYKSTLKMGGISQGLGDVTSIEVPDPTQYGKFIEAAQVRGQVERATFSLMGRYASAVKSSLMSLAKAGCTVDVQCHIGECVDPSDFNSFSKSVIFESVLPTNYSTEDMGALGSDEQAKVDETIEVSAKKYYEVVPLSFGVKASDIVTVEVVDICFFSSAACGECGAEDDGCKQIYALTIAANGSPTQPPDVIFSLDKGTTWAAHDVDTMSTSIPVAVAGIGNYVVVAANTINGLHYALKSEFVAGVDPTFVLATTGFVAGGKPQDMYSVGRKAFIVGNAGYVYFCTDPTAGVTVLDAGSTTTAQLNAVHAISENEAVAVGNFGAVIYTKNQTVWSVSPFPLNVNLTAVWMRDEDTWYVGTTDGKLYYTTNSGSTWVRKVLPGTTPSSIQDIAFSTASVGYVAAVVSARARIYRTFDGGYSWIVTPEEAGKTLPYADKANAIAVCPDANFVVAGGLGDDGADGIILVGQG